MEKRKLRIVRDHPLLGICEYCNMQFSALSSDVRHTGSIVSARVGGEEIGATGSNWEEGAGAGIWCNTRGPTTVVQPPAAGQTNEAITSVTPPAAGAPVPAPSGPTVSALSGV
jgi:hypothetical protein